MITTAFPDKIGKLTESPGTAFGGLSVASRLQAFPELPQTKNCNPFIRNIFAFSSNRTLKTRFSLCRELFFFCASFGGYGIRHPEGLQNRFPL
jgi:hypothetical protein